MSNLISNLVDKYLHICNYCKEATPTLYPGLEYDFNCNFCQKELTLDTKQGMCYSCLIIQRNSHPHFQDVHNSIDLV